MCSELAGVGPGECRDGHCFERDVCPDAVLEGPVSWDLRWFHERIIQRVLAAPAVPECVPLVWRRELVTERGGLWDWLQALRFVVWSAERDGEIHDGAAK